MKALSIRVHGRVQGVYFRASTRHKAVELGIAGWCRNEPDGSVRIYAEGGEEAISKLLSWCHKGPQLAKVDKVNFNEAKIEGGSGFHIRR